MLSKISLRQEFLRALSGSSGLYIFGAFLGFLVGVQLARGLGVSGYGLYGSAMAAASLGATFASGGIQLLTTREVAISRARRDLAGVSRIIEWSVRMTTVLAIAATFAVGAYVYWGQNVSLGATVGVMVFTLLSSLLNLSGAILRGAGAIVLGQALNVAVRPMVQSSLLLVGMLTFTDINPAIALGIASVSVFVAIAAGVGPIRRIWSMGIPRTTPSKCETHLWTSAATTMGLTTVIRAADAAVPLILIGTLATFVEAGLFRVASSAMILPGMAGTMITVMVPAIVARLYENGKTEQLQRLATASCIAWTLPTISIALVLWFFGEHLLGFAFGAEFQPAWLALAILTCDSLVTAFGGVSIALLHAAKKESVVTKAFGISLAISIGGSLWLAPQAGAVGVAAVVLAATVVRTTYLAQATQRLVGIDPTMLAFRQFRIGRGTRKEHL